MLKIKIPKIIKVFKKYTFFYCYFFVMSEEQRILQTLHDTENDKVFLRILRSKKIVTRNPIGGISNRTFEKLSTALVLKALQLGWIRNSVVRYIRGSFRSRPAFYFEKVNVQSKVQISVIKKEKKISLSIGFLGNGIPPPHQKKKFKRDNFNRKLLRINAD